MANNMEQINISLTKKIMSAFLMPCILQIIIMKNTMLNNYNTNYLNYARRVYRKCNLFAAFVNKTIFHHFEP